MSVVVLGALPPLLTPADIARLGIPGTPSDNVVTRWIEKATTRLAVLLRRRGVALTDLVTDPTMIQVVKDVLENAVVRVLRNPGGARSETEGDYAIVHNPLDGSGNIWFPDVDLDLLAPRASSVGTIRVGLPAHRLPPRECW